MRLLNITNHLLSIRSLAHDRALVMKCIWASLPSCMAALLLPASLMLVTDEVRWGVEDFKLNKSHPYILCVATIKRYEKQSG